MISACSWSSAGTLRSARDSDDSEKSEKSGETVGVFRARGVCVFGFLLMCLFSFLVFFFFFWGGGVSSFFFFWGGGGGVGLGPRFWKMDGVECSTLGFDGSGLLDFWVVFLFSNQGMGCRIRFSSENRKRHLGWWHPAK